MQMDIPKEELDGLLSTLKGSLTRRGVIEDEVIQEAKLIVIHPENWEISLLVPLKSIHKCGVIRKEVERALFGDCKVDRDCCDYLGRRKEKGAYEWYFRHPNTPQDICERIEAEIEADLGEEVGLGLPTPSGSKSKNDLVFLTLKDKYFREIESGKKKIEYRNLNQYYCDKFFSPGVRKKYVKFNRGYESGEENQMIFEIEDIFIVSDRGEKVLARKSEGTLISSFRDLPPNFAPFMYGVLLGKRVK